MNVYAVHSNTVGIGCAHSGINASDAVRQHISRCSTNTYDAAQHITHVTPLLTERA